MVLFLFQTALLSLRRHSHYSKDLYLLALYRQDTDTRDKGFTYDLSDNSGRRLTLE